MNMKLRDYLIESTKFSKKQKEDLEHFILNLLMDKSVSHILKPLKTKGETITISKGDAKTIIDNLSKIRQFIIDLPRED